jgi:hypothetical protein
VTDEGFDPPPVKLKSIPAAQLTDEQIEENKSRVKGLLAKLG